MKFLKLLVIISIVCCGLFLSCAKEEANQQEAKTIKIGVSVSTMQEAVYTFMKKAMTDNAEKDNVKLLWISAENNEDKQIADVENLLAQDLDALIIHPVNTGASAQLIQKAKDAGVPVVAMDRLPEGIFVDCYVTADSFKVGQIQAQFLTEKLQGKGNVIILEGEAGNTVARDITAGNKDVLQKSPDIKIVVDIAHKAWARDLAMATVEDALTKNNNNIQGILANNSGMAMGAVQALTAQKLTDKVITVGSDADKDACQSIIKGELSADVDKMPYELGLESYKTALKLAKGEKADFDKMIENGSVQVPVKYTPVRLINKDNVNLMEERWGKLE